MLDVVCNEHQNDWVQLLHVEYAYNNSIDGGTGIVP